MKHIVVRAHASNDVWKDVALYEYRKLITSISLLVVAAIIALMVLFVDASALLVVLIPGITWLAIVVLTRSWLSSQIKKYATSNDLLWLDDREYYNWKAIVDTIDTKAQVRRTELFYAIHEAQREGGNRQVNDLLNDLLVKLSSTPRT